MDVKADNKEVLKRFGEEQLERSKPAAAAKASLNIHCEHIWSSRVPEVDSGWLLPQVASFKLKRKQRHNCSMYPGACVTAVEHVCNAKLATYKQHQRRNRGPRLLKWISAILIWSVLTKSWGQKLFIREIQFPPFILLSIPAVRRVETG